MKIEKVNLKIGLENPIKLLLTGDNHMSYADERQTKPEYDHSEMRNIQYFSCGMGHDNLKNRFAETVKYAKENCDLLVMAGDVIDHPAELNKEIFAETLKGCPGVYAVGNHDYNNYSVESESPELLESRFGMLENLLGYKPYNYSYRIGGLNIVTLQDVFYSFDQSAVEHLQAEIKRGLPILLLFHIPLYAPTLVEDVNNYWHQPIMTGTPAFEYEKIGRSARPITNETKLILELIRTEPLICGVLAGHIHFSHFDMLPQGKPQIVCEAGYLGSATEIEIV